MGVLGGGAISYERGTPVGDAKSTSSRTTRVEGMGGVFEAHRLLYHSTLGLRLPVLASLPTNLPLCRSPLPSEDGTTKMSLRTFALKTAQAMALTGLCVSSSLRSGVDLRRNQSPVQAQRNRVPNRTGSRMKRSRPGSQPDEHQAHEYRAHNLKNGRSVPRGGRQREDG